MGCLLPGHDGLEIPPNGRGSLDAAVAAVACTAPPAPGVARALDTNSCGSVWTLRPNDRRLQSQVMDTEVKQEGFGTTNYGP